MSLQIPSTPPAAAAPLAALSSAALASAEQAPLVGLALERAPTAAQLAAFSRRLGAEVALVEDVGARSAAGSRYMLLTGTAHGVTVPVGPRYRLLCHTELGGTRRADASSRDLAYLSRAAALGAPQSHSHIVRVAKRGEVAALIRFDLGSASAPPHPETPPGPHPRPRYSPVDPSLAIDLGRSTGVLDPHGMPHTLRIAAAPGVAEFARLAQPDEAFPEQRAYYKVTGRPIELLFGELNPWNGATAFPMEVLSEITPDKRVLDVGCGLGQLVEDLRARGVDAYGIDPADEMPHADYLIRAGVQQKDAFPAEHFDIALHSHSIFDRNETLEFWLAALERIAYWLKPGGSMHLGTCLSPESLAKMVREDLPSLRVVALVPPHREVNRLEINGYIHIVKDPRPAAH